ncbi:MAG: nitrous oxide-stimulated promoter family protein [Phycisphaeraceae bacterium]|nr:nitrous oxide-stimulated promoter family protein [Phycisphaeraceae bacterium]
MSIRYEQQMVLAMLKLYCQKKHGTAKGKLCDECAQLQSYAHSRLDKCPFGDDKSTCKQCAIHCYKPQLREQISQVMRYAGPRMLYHHPLMSLKHLFKETFSKR